MTPDGQGHLRLKDQLCEQLLARQVKPGCWKDFFLSQGASDIWVSAYVGLALAEYASLSTTAPRLGVETALRACRDFLLCARHPAGGWGYNAFSDIDADSTSIALRFFKAAGFEAPRGAIGMLKLHAAQDGSGFRTYRHAPERNRWGWAHPEMTATAVLTLLERDHIDQIQARRLWSQRLQPFQRRDGDWAGFWWSTNAYPTLCVSELAARLGVSPRPLKLEVLDRDLSAFDLACWAMSAQHLGQANFEAAALSLLADIPEFETGQWLWPSGAPLQAPANWPGEGRDEYSLDYQGVFTVATLLRLACRSDGRAAWRDFEDQLSKIQPSPVPTTIPAIREENHKWRGPGTRLTSVLSDGELCECSLRLSDQPHEAVRLTCEPANPQLAAPDRFARQIRTLLGLKNGPASFETLKPALGSLLRACAADVTKIDDPRFLIWLGLDGADEPAGDQTWKLYLNSQLFGAKPDLESVFDRLLEAGIATGELKKTNHHISNILSSGELQEVGIGFQGARHGFKLYWQYDGWDQTVLDDITGALGLPQTLNIPLLDGLVTERELKRLPMGCAVRLTPEGRWAPDVTAAVPLPDPENPDIYLTRDFPAICARKNWPARSLTGFMARQAPARFKPSLVTVTQTPSELKRTLYLRPLPETP